MPDQSSNEPSSPSAIALESRPIAGGSHAGRTLWIVLPMLGGAAVFFWAWAAGTPATESPVVRVRRPVPPFALTERDGRIVTQADLLGKVWVANFIFTRCPGPCPKLSARMHALQRSLSPRAKDVRLVSFSVDPINDTPRALRHYARRFKADASMWLFLTGKDREVIYDLIIHGFLQPVIPATADEPLAHSNYFVVVDREGNIRSFHNGLEKGATERVLHAVEQLLSESAPA